MDDLTMPELIDIPDISIPFRKIHLTHTNKENDELIHLTNTNKEIKKPKKEYRKDAVYVSEYIDDTEKILVKSNISNIYYFSLCN